MGYQKCWLQNKNETLKCEKMLGDQSKVSGNCS